MSKPLCIDLYAGLGGWSEGFLAEGYECVGYDIERHDYGTGGYPGTLVIQDVLRLHGSQFAHATVIVASPPCQRYSYMAQPWTRAKALIAWHRESPERIKDLNALFNACFRIQLEASRAARRYIPMIVENVRGAQPWVGRAKAHYGSFYLWGDVAMHGNKIVHPWDWSKPFLRAPIRSLTKRGTHFYFLEKYGIPGPLCDDGVKVAGLNWSGSDKPGYKAKAFNDTAVSNWRSEQESGVKCHGQKNGEEYAMTRGPVGDGVKVPSDEGQRTDPGKGARFTTRDCGFEGVKQPGSSKSNSRKAASAEIAKIPFALSQWVARTYKP